MTCIQIQAVYNIITLVTPAANMEFTASDPEV
jgi:hypothetical protein